MAKSLKISYALCCLTGIFGGHHLYLGQDAQCFLWFSTLGGFLLGFFADLCKLPSYVAQANRSPVYFSDWESKRGRRVKELQLPRWIGAYFVSCYYECICVYAFDTYFQQVRLDEALFLFKALGRALAIYLCFSIGLKRTRFRWCLLSSVLAEALLRGLSTVLIASTRRLPLLFGESDPLIFILAQLPFIITSSVAYRKQKYREDVERPRHVCIRLPCLMIAGISWTVLFSSAMYNHLEVPLSLENPTQTQKLKYVIRDFIRSDFFLSLQDSISSLSRIWINDGFATATDKTLALLASFVSSTT